MEYGPPCVSKQFGVEPTGTLRPGSFDPPIPAGMGRLIHRARLAMVFWHVESARNRSGAYRNLRMVTYGRPATTSSRR